MAVCRNKANQINTNQKHRPLVVYACSTHRYSISVTCELVQVFTCCSIPDQNEFICVSCSLLQIQRKAYKSNKNFTLLHCITTESQYICSMLVIYITSDVTNIYSFIAVLYKWPVQVCLIQKNIHKRNTLNCRSVHT